MIFLYLTFLALTGFPVVQGEQYVLHTDGTWGESDTTVVVDAGGAIMFAHEATGIAIVESNNPNFLDKINDVDSSIDFAEADAFVTLDQPKFEEYDVTPEDEPFFTFQWNMEAIEAPSAWEAGCDGTGARVAVIDGGIYDTHPDIAPNLDTSCSTSFVPGFPFNTDVGWFWHGTHVAGIVAAADNGVGVIGVAPHATLMHVKVLHDGSGSFGAVIEGILFAVDPTLFGTECTEPAHVINLSLGASIRARLSPGFNGLLNKLVNFASSRGVLVVSSAGNEGLDFGQQKDLFSAPAQAGNGLAISATGPVDFFNGGSNYRRIASYTNYGEDLVDLAAPGGDFSNYPNDFWYFDMVLSPCRGTSIPPSYSFCFAAGTSMASPVVAGVAALIKGANPRLSLGALIAKLKNTADDEGRIGKDEFYGHGFVNAFRACVE